MHLEFDEVVLTMPLGWLQKRLDTFIPPITPGFLDSIQTIQIVAQGLASEWLKDELNGCGSYCNFPIGVEEADKDVETIRH
jgi:hypothetical protein